MNNNIEEFYQHNDLFYKQTKSSIRKIKIISNIAIFICVVVTYILMEENDFFSDAGENYLYIGMTVLLIIYAIRNMKIRRLENQFKQAVIPGIIQNITPSLTYNAGAGHTEEEFKKTEIYTGTIDRFYSSDLIEGNIDKTNIKISYVVASNKQKTGKTKMHIPVFEGTLITSDFNKNFSGKTKIYTKDLFAKIESFFNSGDDKYEKITFENQEFNDKFIVETTDIQQAFYILSPKLIENILKLQSYNNSSREMDILFLDNRMYIAFENERFLDMSKTNKYMQQIELFRNDINDIVNMVEILELNNRIWSKE